MAMSGMRIITGTNVYTPAAFMGAAVTRDALLLEQEPSLDISSGTIQRATRK